MTKKTSAKPAGKPQGQMGGSDSEGQQAGSAPQAPQQGSGSAPVPPVRYTDWASI